MRPVILLVDSQVSAAFCWKQVLGMCACDVVEAGVAEVGKWTNPERPVLVVVNVHSTQDALQAVHDIRQTEPGLPLVLIVRTGTEQLAVSAFRAGISDYFHLPGEETALLAAVQLLITPHNGAVCQTGGSPGSQEKEFPFIASSPSMQSVKSHVARVAVSNSNVLITGETGTGKELIAAAIHQMSARRNNAFVCVNCAAIPEALVESELFGYERGAFTGAHARKAGWLETSHQGTMFLDEIGDMTPFTQAKLLRVIESKEFHRLGGKTQVSVNVRFVAATNRNLEDMASEGKFRQDLYYRLNTVRIHLPPLRDRKEDIPLLIRHYMRELSAQNQKRVTEMSDEVWTCLMSYDWPGNIRELKNLLEGVLVNSVQGTIHFDDLPEQFRQRLEKPVSADGDERRQLLTALLRTKWNKSRAAEELHWSRMTLYRKMHKYRIFTSRAT
jgi:DNA-binding NtrC family response regulator